MQWTRQHTHFAFALLAGALLRLLFIVRFPHVYGDSLVYADLATNLLRHHTFALSQGGMPHPTLIRVPGYPLLVAAIFAVFGDRNFTAVIAFQLLLDLASCVLLAALAGRLAGRRAAVITLWIAALCPFTANYTAAPLTEIPAIFCAVLVFYALDRWRPLQRAGHPWNRWFWMLAATLSYAIFLRPDRALLALAAIAAVISFSRSQDREQGIVSLRSRYSAVTALCALLLLAPALWAMRNWHTFHRFQPLAPRSATDPGEFVSNGFNRWYRTWAIDLDSTFDVYWTYDGARLSMDDLPSRAFDTATQRAQTAAIYDQYNLSLAASPAVDQAFAALAADRVHAHPIRYYVLLPVARLADMWLRPRTAMLPVAVDWWHVSAHPALSAVAIALGLVNVAYLTLAAIGLWRWRRAGWSGRRALGYSMVLFVLFRCALLLTLDNAESRYTLDAYPVVLLLAGLALAGFRSRTRPA